MSRLAALAVGILLTAPAILAVPAADKPLRTQGLDEARLEQFSLPAQLTPGYELRARRIVFAPGGTVVEHSHVDRPGVAYVLEGSMTEHRGNVARVVRAGDTWAEDATAVHWLENTTDRPCIFLSVDLVKKQG